MAEVVGIVASVISLCQAAQAVAEGVNHAIELYRAPKEIRSLKTVEASTKFNTGGQSYNALSRAQNVVQELHHLITVTLVKQGDVSGRARWRLCLRHKRKIIRLRDRLRDARRVLLEPLNADLLSSSQHIESALTAISQTSRGNQTITMVIGQQLDRIENALGCQQLGTVGTTAFLPAQKALAVHMQPKQVVTSSPRTTSMSSGHDDEVVIPQDEHDTGVSQGAPQIDLFFTSRGETLMVQESGPTLFCYHNREMKTTEYFREYQCALHFYQAPRRWMRLTLSMTVSAESAYWNAIECVSLVDPMWKTRHHLPKPLQSAMEAFLRSEQDLTEIEQDMHLRTFLGSKPISIQKSGRLSNLSVELSQSLDFNVRRYLENISGAVEHWIIPKYYEGNLIHRAIPDHAWGFFLAWVNSRWVFECRFGSEQSQIDSVWYTLRVLHSLAGARPVPGVGALLGVVLDQESRIVTGYLSELPAKGFMTRILTKATAAGQPVSWERRLKWCRQIVYAVAEIHSQGFVVGTLHNTPNSIVGIDADDNALLIRRFATTFPYNDSIRGSLPPEYRYTTPPGGSLEARPATDVYHLGYLLWRIAATKDSLPPLERCVGTDCTQAAHCVVCSQNHATLASPPSPREETPKYFNDMILACLTDTPGKRIRARELLDMFSLVTDHTLLGIVPEQCGGDKPPHPRQCLSNKLSGCGPRPCNRWEDVMAIYGPSASCDYCSKAATAHRFHCGICNSSDFDICVSCFAQGKHCLNQEHYLREYRHSKPGERGYPNLIDVGYYTNVKDTGIRLFRPP